MKDGLTQVKELKDKIHEQYIEIQELNKARKTDIEYSKYLQKEIIRLNNIINELEEYLIEEIEDYEKQIKYHKKNKDLRSGILDLVGEYEGEKVCFEDTLGKLQELKGENNE